MAKLLVLITAQAEAAREIGAGWKQAGAPGVTFIEGYGLQTLRQASDSMEILSGTTSMLEILRQTTTNVVIALCLLEDDTLVDKLAAVTDTIIGDMETPNNGVMFVLDVEKALGVFHHHSS